MQKFAFKVQSSLLLVALSLVLSAAVVSVAPAVEQVTGGQTTVAHAKASKAALKKLKGNWYTAGGYYDRHPEYKVRFTKSYVKYYRWSSSSKKWVYSWKAKISKTKKKKAGYAVYCKNRGGKYMYYPRKTSRGIMLDCFSGGWTKRSASYYCGSESLVRTMS